MLDGAAGQGAPTGRTGPTSGQFSRWGPAQRPAGPRAAHCRPPSRGAGMGPAALRTVSAIPMYGSRRTLGFPPRRNHLGTGGPSRRPPSAGCAGPHREDCPEVGVPLPARRSAWWLGRNAPCSASAWRLLRLGERSCGPPCRPEAGAPNYPRAPRGSGMRGGPAHHPAQLRYPRTKEEPQGRMAPGFPLDLRMMIRYRNQLGPDTVQLAKLLRLALVSVSSGSPPTASDAGVVRRCLP